MARKANPTVDFALTVPEQINSRLRLAPLLAALGLAVLAPTAASACGRLPVGVELSGPVLRGGVAPHGAPAQPVMMPHCSLTPAVDGTTVSAPPDRPDNSGASSVGRLAEPKGKLPEGERS